ncbi:butyrophilin subfamily 1 member A1-like [Perognathus longimembris pacificus]|uniref:butyrophilin subfamily 1 member A1-like n=1 Tax=Perognathus longimembris pacificus TaxID=214514 RepID=UPI0020188B8D|nr:butyrophilin subfamily 1 member A1-like [Perognathus longimembris pacificus]
MTKVPILTMEDWCLPLFPLLSTVVFNRVLRALRKFAPVSCYSEKTWKAFPPNSPSRYLLIFIFLQLPKLNLGNFEVMGPLEPIQSLVGEDAELPCYLSPPVSAEYMELRWFRNTFSPPVWMRSDLGQEQEQMPEYQGRVTLVQDNITSGHAAVKIHDIRVSDEGIYGCFFSDKHAQGQAFIHLRVAALGTDPHISMEVQDKGQIHLKCTSEGWYPKPKVQWRTATGEKLSSMADVMNPDEEGLFTVVAPVVITDNSIESVFCSIQNLLLNQEKKAEISIPDLSFPVWKTLIGIAVCLGVIIGLFFTWKWCERKKRRDKIDYLKWEMARSNAVDVTLDPDTAHPSLSLSEDLKSFHQMENSHQNLPDKKGRFMSWPCVLGREGLTSGRHYWEVEVGDRTDWLIGVCQEDSKRKQFIPISPKEGFWVIELSDKGFWALLSPRIPLSVTVAPDKVGIFLDHKSGTVSFYNVNTRSHIFTFPKNPFSGAVYPLFLLWSTDKKPLTICPVFDES